MATFVVREGVLPLDKEQLQQLQEARHAQSLSGLIIQTSQDQAQHLLRRARVGLVGGQGR